MRLSHSNRASCKVRVPVFVFRPLPTEESNRRLSVQTPSDRSIGHALAAWQSGILQSRGAHFCMLSFRPGESNRWLSVHTPSDRSIDHALAAWQTGILQSQGTCFCILILSIGRVQLLAQRPYPLRLQHRPCACRIAIGHPAKSRFLFLYADTFDRRVQSQI